MGARATLEHKNSGLAMDKLPVSRAETGTDRLGSGVVTKLTLVIEDCANTNHQGKQENKTQANCRTNA